MSQSVEPVDSQEQWKHVEDAKERKKIQNRNAQRAYRSEHESASQRKRRCMDMGLSSERTESTEFHIATEPSSLISPSPTASRRIIKSLTPPAVDIYTGSEALRDMLDDDSSTSLLDLSWAMDSSLTFCNFPSTTTWSCIKDPSVIPSDMNGDPAKAGVNPGEPCLQPPQSLPLEGQTALHIAAGSGAITTVTTLLQMSADVLVKDGVGRTALHVAVERSQEAVVAELVKHKSLLDEVNHKGETALHLAARAGNDGIVRILLRAGSGIEMKDSDGRTALHMSAMYNNDVVLKLLLVEGADIDARIRTCGNVL
ncbi:hypothetical protein N0V90_012535 [Kalmusia sp. IMI 367209]|nr:hypothetical protein N0V90_012535 [Kalmusia sp. IMI 367209]